jgi:predicted alpha/beta-fold hydrolase
MPLITHSSYRPPAGFSNPHLQTLWPTLVRPRPRPALIREEFPLEDGDFLDLDHWSPAMPTERLAVLCHGLEGHSRAVYMLGLGRALVEAGWQVLLMNFRGCSGRPNRLWRSYHSGETGDLLRVLRSQAASGRWRTIVPVGFSLGGSVVLNLMARRDPELPDCVAGAAAVSVPCDLAACARRMQARENWLYMQRFVLRIRRKLREKIGRLPVDLTARDLAMMRTFADIDGLYTAPAHGFLGAEDYWACCSCLPVLKEIRRPSLLLLAQDDPFLTPECHPLELARNHPGLHFEQAPAGGHLGFVGRVQGPHYWHELRVRAFLQTLDLERP